MKYAEFEIGKAAAFAGASTGAGHGNAAHHQHIHRFHLFEADFLPMLERAADGSHFLKGDATPLEFHRVKPEERKILTEFRHGGIEDFAV